MNCIRAFDKFYSPVRIPYGTKSKSWVYSVSLRTFFHHKQNLERNALEQLDLLRYGSYRNLPGSAISARCIQLALWSWVVSKRPLQKSFVTPLLGSSRWSVFIYSQSTENFSSEPKFHHSVRASENMWNIHQGNC